MPNYLLNYVSTTLIHCFSSLIIHVDSRNELSPILFFHRRNVKFS